MKSKTRQKVKVENSPPAPTPDREALIQAYEDFARQYNGLEETTLGQYTFQLKPFFDWLFETTPKQLNEIDFCHLLDFFLEHGKSSIYGPMRSFLNFCHVMGYMDRDLKFAVPMVRKTALAGVPFVLDDEDVDTLLAGIDRSAPEGKRDYAMLQVMNHYGIRGVQVRQMKLDDLLWRQSLIMIRPAKGGTAVDHPLLPAVGNAVLDYIRNARPQSDDYQEVFLTCQEPVKPLAQSTLTMIVARRLRRAKIDLPDTARKGSHLFRHRFASKMLDCGVALEQIADMLGHRNLNSTMIYTKIDFKKLVVIAQEWPEVIS